LESSVSLGIRDALADASACWREWPGDEVGADAEKTLLGYRRLGHGKRTVLVLHEWLGDHRNYFPTMPYLDLNRFTYIFADLRGYGLSRSMNGRFSATEAAADAIRLMDRLGVESFDVVGHSMSGLIGQRVLLDAQRRVGCLVAIAPVPASGFPLSASEKQKLVAVIGDDHAAKAMIASRTSGRYGQVWLDWKLAMVRRAALPEAMGGYLDMFTQTDFAAQAVGVRTPVFAIVGAHDIPFYREASVRRGFEPLYPNFKLLVSQEAGHYPMLETPVLLASQIEAFLAN
jgi:3-oxoadipate enol-lactonase